MEPTPLKDLRCLRCQSELFEIVNIEGKDRYKLPNGEVNWCYVNDSIVALCCTQCQTFLFGCDECSETHSPELFPDDKVVLCQFLGYHTELNVKEYKGAAIIKNEYGDDDELEFEGYREWPVMYLDFSHLNQYYASFHDPNMSQVELKSLTGPDGGFGHHWKCTRCDKEFSLSDK